MNKKMKNIILILMIILLVIGSGMAIFSYATTITIDGEKIYESDNSSLGTVVNDTRKLVATLNNADNLPITLKSNQFKYVARDLSVYKNLYCVQHSRSLDNDAKVRPWMILRATAMAEINGNKANFYTYDANGNQSTNGTVTCIENNVIAGILTETNSTTEVVNTWGEAVPRT